MTQVSISTLSAPSGNAKNNILPVLQTYVTSLSKKIGGHVRIFQSGSRRIYAIHSTNEETLNDYLRLCGESGEIKLLECENFYNIRAEFENSRKSVLSKKPVEMYIHETMRSIAVLEADLLLNSWKRTDNAVSLSQAKACLTFVNKVDNRHQWAQPNLTYFFANRVTVYSTDARNTVARELKYATM